jgi:hypothetical protein
MAMLLAVLALPPVARGDEQAVLKRAEALAHERRFAEAEAIYREVIRASPRSRPAAIGLARVLLWEGRYREARERFLALGDREGAATAAYWQGDFRTAAREFGTLDTSFARESREAIAAAARGSDRLDIDWLSDDQPFRSLQTLARSSTFTDPLTRWDVTAGLLTLTAPELDRHSRLARVVIGNETVFPWQRVTLTTSAGAQRYPDGSTRPVGAIAARFRPTSKSSIAISVIRREVLTNATALRSHPFVSAASISWQRYAENSWMAGAESGLLRYFDHNRGQYAQGYALLPVVRHVFAGASAAVRDTSDNRFYLEAVAGSRNSSGGFDYSYRGGYTPYWTPRSFREVRALVVIDGAFRRAAWKVQLERGVSRDTATAFGPSSGTTSLPSPIFAFDFRRTARPSRAAVSVSWPAGTRYRIDATAERNTTAFYAANSIHASLVRQR